MGLRIRILYGVKDPDFRIEYVQYSKGPDFQCGMGLQFTIKTGGGDQRTSTITAGSCKNFKLCTFS